MHRLNMIHRLVTRDQNHYAGAIDKSLLKFSYILSDRTWVDISRPIGNVNLMINDFGRWVLKVSIHSRHNLDDAHP